jgi:Tfp pilus assembly protein PilV
MLVALVLLTVGLLAVAGTTTSTLRLQRGSDSRSLAAALVESRLELARAEECAALQGDSSIGAVTESWELHPIAAGASELTISIAISDGLGHAPGAEIFRSVVPC